MNSKELKFVIFILNKYALALKLPIKEVYAQFEVLGIIDNYLIKHYEVLHTLGENYLIEDLKGFITKKMNANNGGVSRV